MTGTAIVTIGNRQWLVDLAITYQELVTGLGGLPSMPVDRGMLFDLGYEQVITVTTVPMLFPLDIVFIGQSLAVTEVALGVAPGYLVTSSLPARYFLEVNAGEAQGITAGDPVTIGLLQAQQAIGGLVSQLVNLAASMMVVIFAFGLLKGMVKGILPRPKGERLLPQAAARTWLPQTEGKRPTRQDVKVDSWVERDRIGIWITDNRTGQSLIEWWDEAAAQMFEDGWFKPGDVRQQKITGRAFEESVLDYAEYIGLLTKSGGSGVTYLPQTIERGEVIEISFQDAPAWVREEWRRLHGATVPRVRVYRTTVARVGPPVFEYAVRDIVAYKAGRTMTRYVPSYESLLAVTPEDRALYFGGAVKLGPDEAIAVMDFWGDRFKSINLYVHPAAYEPPRLIVPGLTERQMRILATIRAYTPPFRKEVFRNNKVTEANLDELRKLGLIDQRGAITVMGRNVAGREKPLESSPALLPAVARQLSQSSQTRLIGTRERREKPEELEFLADSPDQCCTTVDGTGLRPQLERTFREAIARARGNAAQSGAR